MSKDEGGRNSSFSEKPVRPRPRRLVDCLNLTGAKRVPFHSFFGISEVLRLRESCMRENRTCSLRGGRRPACKRASSDPTGICSHTALRRSQQRKSRLIVCFRQVG